MEKSFIPYGFGVMTHERCGFVVSDYIVEVIVIDTPRKTGWLTVRWLNVVMWVLLKYKGVTFTFIVMVLWIAI